MCISLLPVVSVFRDGGANVRRKWLQRQEILESLNPLSASSFAGRRDLRVPAIKQQVAFHWMGSVPLGRKSGASAPRQSPSSIGALVPVSAHAAVSNPQKGCRLHRRPSTFLSADAYPIAALRRTAARLNPGAAIKQIQHNLLVAVRVQVELDLLRRRALRIRRADRDLLAAARVTAEINRDLFSRRRV